MNIYKVTNKVNGKVYIGKCSEKWPLRRWRRHVVDALKRNSNTHFHRAIRKHGVDSFAVEIIHKATTEDELYTMEIFFILWHEANNPEKGYNMTEGGDGAIPGQVSPNKGKKFSALWRQHMSEAGQGRPSHRKGKRLPKEHRDAIARGKIKVGRNG